VRSYDESTIANLTYGQEQAPRDSRWTPERCTTKCLNSRHLLRTPTRSPWPKARRIPIWLSFPRAFGPRSVQRGYIKVAVKILDAISQLTSHAQDRV